MIVKTNVKLNLGLSVLRKRADGFHDIETLFVPCFDFGDNLEIVTGDDYSRTSAAMFAKYGGQTIGEPEPSVGEPVEPTGLQESAKEGGKGATLSGRMTVSEDSRLVQGISGNGKLMITIAREEGVDWDPLKDLCAKAYDILAQDFDLPPVKIFLEKKAPVGAGLGGGSADAAFTLNALNELCGLNLSDQQLSEYAARLGSDCAFFVFNRPMIGSGRGEVLEPYDIDLSEYEIKVLIPEGISVSTAEAYKGIVPQESHFDKLSDRHSHLCPPIVGPAELAKPDTINDLKTALAMPVTDWKDKLVNDFETTVFKAHPELAAIKQSLYDSGAVYASMSGSGSALFALYEK